MDFAMKDFESVALQTATGNPVNVQQKKPFDIADVDNNVMKLESDDWNIDSIFPLNNDFNDLAELHMDTNWTEAYEYLLSPTSTGTGTESENDHDMLGMKPIADQMLSPPQNLISSSSSDSGLSSDHIDFDMHFDQMGSDLSKQPLLSSQIIPELTDDELTINKPEVKVVKPDTNAGSNVHKVIRNAQPIPVKYSAVEPKATMQKVQFVKRIPTNIVQANATVKSMINDNAVTNAPIVINKVNGNISGIRKVVQVKKGPNQKSIILPFSLKNGTDIRSIKIIKPSSLTKSPKILMAASNLLQEYKQNTIVVNKPVKVEPKYEIDSMSEPSDCESYKFEEMFVQDDDDDDDDDVNNESDADIEINGQQSEYPKLVLSNEEKRLLAKEGITLPAHYPLTKHEERELKRIRRKIRNKISAQDSRKRKKEYVDGLEERVKKSTDENQTLWKRIKLLETQNKNLMNQVKKMQILLTKGGNKSVQPATCLMVLLMSMALIAAPNLKLNKDSNDVMPSDIMMEENQMQQSRRSLLFDLKEKFGDMVADEEIGTDFGMFCDKSESEHNYADTPRPADGSAKPLDKKIDGLIDSLDLDDSVWVPPKNKSLNSTPIKSEPLDVANANLMKNIHIDLNGLSDTMSATVMHAKIAKNLSDVSPESGYPLKLEPNGLPNIILNAEINAKNV